MPFSRRQREQAAARTRHLHRMAAWALLPVAALVLVRYYGTVSVDDLLTGPRNAAERLEPGLDPNAASWWELAELPGLGETKAKAVVSYRRRIRQERNDPQDVVFRRVGDLEQVHGIGPKTVGRLEPYLVFPPE